MCDLHNVVHCQNRWSGRISYAAQDYYQHTYQHSNGYVQPGHTAPFMRVVHSDAAKPDPILIFRLVKLGQIPEPARLKSLKESQDTSLKHRRFAGEHPVQHTCQVEDRLENRYAGHAADEEQSDNDDPA